MHVVPETVYQALNGRGSLGWAVDPAGLLRQYFPKGTDLGVPSPEGLAVVAPELSRIPCEILGWHGPAKHLA